MVWNRFICQSIFNSQLGEFSKIINGSYNAKNHTQSNLFDFLRKFLSQHKQIHIFYVCAFALIFISKTQLKFNHNVQMRFSGMAVGGYRHRFDRQINWSGIFSDKLGLMKNLLLDSEERLRAWVTKWAFKIFF